MPNRAERNRPDRLRPGQRPERPQLRSFFDARQEAWLVLEPHRIGVLAGVLTGTLLLLIQLIRQVNGAVLDVTQVLLWALITFVVSYGVVGIFVWYLLYIAERELPVLPPEARQTHRLGGDTESGAATQEEES